MYFKKILTVWLMVMFLATNMTAQYAVVFAKGNDTPNEISTRAIDKSKTFPNYNNNSRGVETQSKQITSLQDERYNVLSNESKLDSSLRSLSFTGQANTSITTSSSIDMSVKKSITLSNSNVQPFDCTSSIDENGKITVKFSMNDNIKSFKKATLKINDQISDNIIFNKAINKNREFIVSNLTYPRLYSYTLDVDTGKSNIINSYTYQFYINVQKDVNNNVIGTKVSMVRPDINLMKGIMGINRVVTTSSISMLKNSLTNNVYIAPDAYEPNDDHEHATDVINGKIYYENFNVTPDMDCHKLVVNEKSDVSIKISNIKYSRLGFGMSKLENNETTLIWLEDSMGKSEYNAFMTLDPGTYYLTTYHSAADMDTLYADYHTFQVNCMPVRNNWYKITTKSKIFYVQQTTQGIAEARVCKPGDSSALVCKYDNGNWSSSIAYAPIPDGGSVATAISANSMVKSRAMLSSPNPLYDFNLVPAIAECMNQLYTCMGFDTSEMSEYDNSMALKGIEVGIIDSVFPEPQVGDPRTYLLNREAIRRLYWQFSETSEAQAQNNYYYCAAKANTEFAIMVAAKCIQNGSTALAVTSLYNAGVSMSGGLVILAASGGTGWTATLVVEATAVEELAKFGVCTVVGVAAGTVATHAQTAMDNDNYMLSKVLSKGGADANVIHEVSELGPNKINHILQDKHLWSKVVSDPNDWNQVSKVMSKVMEQGVEGPYKDVFSKILDVNGHTVEVTYTKLSNGIIKISDAWVRP